MSNCFTGSDYGKLRHAIKRCDLTVIKILARIKILHLGNDLLCQVVRWDYRGLRNARDALRKVRPVRCGRMSDGGNDTQASHNDSIRHLRSSSDKILNCVDDIPHSLQVKSRVV